MYGVGLLQDFCQQLVLLILPHHQALQQGDDHIPFVGADFGGAFRRGADDIDMEQRRKLMGIV